jgi:hypothetical protein
MADLSILVDTEALHVREPLSGGRVQPFDPRKVGRLVAVRTTAGKLRPARITAVGTGFLITCVVKGAETYTNLPKWSRLTPSTAGWIRT